MSVRKATKSADGSPSKKQNVKKHAYDSSDVHADLEKGHYAGIYGGANAAWFGLAEIRGQVDMSQKHTERSSDERYIPSMVELLEHPRTRRRWGDLCSIDPLGMWATRPTMAATTANMIMPEIHDLLVRDGTVVNKDDGSIKLVKMAVDYVWNMPMVADRINMTEQQVRDALYKYTKAEAVKKPDIKTFLPPLGGMTVYFFGDATKLSDPSTEVAVRVHDSCCGSDVFGTDICTCRPYLAFAVQACVECAQRGGVGVVVYFQKEGRSLGEVTKFRVYNARKAQEGGDTADKYFHVTESIAGIRDARFQEMMPDPLLWLGITKIDILLSMSNEKYDALTSAGIQIMERVPLPDSFVPKNAHIEINAKVASGYHAEEGVDSAAISASLRELAMVRERCAGVTKIVKSGKGSYFKFDKSKMAATAKFVADTCTKNYPTLDIPYHARWRHFKAGSVEKMEAGWHCDALEAVRRKLDLATVSVLLDAGAGATYKYIDEEGDEFRRSEALAVASFDCFANGLFSSDEAQPMRVNARGLRKITEADLARGFQVTKTNAMNGMKGRFNLMAQLADALQANPEFFGHEVARPGNLVDYVLKHCDKKKKVSIKVLWKAIIEGLESIWPESLTGVRRGDVHVYAPLFHDGIVASDFVPFHKLSQWLTYSLLEPLEGMGLTFTETHLLTGLSEYRNGGLFVDMGVLVPLHDDTMNGIFAVGSELVVEWRACTLILLDELAVEVRKLLKKTEAQLPLSKVLEGGTWAAGRLLAKQRRPETGAPPINVRSDGNVF